MSGRLSHLTTLMKMIIRCGESHWYGGSNLVLSTLTSAFAQSVLLSAIDFAAIAKTDRLCL
jgi:hypothetical protein